MRYGSDQKKETRAKIVSAAARAFRENGAQGEGIAHLMKELGLTHGGFYRHFGSKEDLYVEAISQTLRKASEQMVARAQAASKGQGLRAIIEEYLSPEQLDRIGEGCVMAALAPEIARQSPAVQARINVAMQGHMNRMLPFFPGATLAEKRRKFLILFPAMAGVMMMARTMADPNVRKEMLSSARRFYIDAFARKV